MAFSHIAEQFEAPPGSVVMDAGCGSCAKSRHLVDQGFRVLGTDLSEEALDMAREAIDGTPYSECIDLRQANLTKISMEDNSVRYIVCWGVLMHIPAVADAIGELSRILKPGGRLAISEGNMKSIQTRTIRFLKKLLKKERAEVQLTSAGIENWEDTRDGRLMTRQADIGWLVAEFEKHGIKLIDRRAGQFSELYWLVPTQFLKKAIHAINSLWFKYIKRPGPAFGNILVLEKEGNET
jgi:ubiquinone/menaquinone biosynthesis C-methylase UbiE